MPIAAGTRIGPYEIVGWLGAGGMGEVYRARDPRLGREVALKLIPEAFATDGGRVNRFEQEARAAGQLNHPNILAVYDIGVHDGAPYIVSELLDGESLRDRLRGGPLPTRKAVDYARQIAAGLAVAHDKGIVHRDVKPDNLFITSDGRVKILDFGIAKLTRPSDDRPGMTTSPTATAEGMVVGTAGYMSPEQVRGEAVDARSDIFSVGTVLHEMLTGRPPFARDTAAETMAAVLNEDPREPLPATVSPALVRIVSRCLEKTREMRFQSARDLAFGLEVLSDTSATAVSAADKAAPRWRLALGITVVVLSLLTAAAGWLTRRSGPTPADNPLAEARFSPFTDWDGTESGAQISPDGRFVAFIADRDGEFDLWVSQVGTGRFLNLTRDSPPLSPPGVVLRSFGFTGDGADIWYSAGGDPGAAKLLVPLMGGTPRPFLAAGDATPDWSPNGDRLAYFNNVDGDPIFVADRTGADPHQIFVDRKGMHSHNLAWSTDGEWIFFVHGPDPTVNMDVWRIQSSGAQPERLTDLHAAVNYLAPIDARTVLYVARQEDRSGPWLWALDVPTKVIRRVSAGLEQYTSVSASNDGRRVVATMAKPVVNLWKVPIGAAGAAPAGDGDVQSYSLPTAGAVAPRFGGQSAFYLSTRGTADGLWRSRDGQASEIWRNPDGPLTEPVTISKDGTRIAVVVRKGKKRQLVVMSADGTESRTLAVPIDIQGVAGQAAADWSPDGKWLVTSGTDAQGSALFKIPVDGGAPVRLVAEEHATNPVWSPRGDLIVYAGAFVGGQSPLLAMRPDGTPVPLPAMTVNQGAYRFLPDGSAVVYMSRLRVADYGLLDLATMTSRQIVHLSREADVGTFDIAPGGKEIVFDRSRENSDIYLIDLPK